MGRHELPIEAGRVDHGEPERNHDSPRYPCGRLAGAPGPIPAEPIFPQARLSCVRSVDLRSVSLSLVLKLRETFREAAGGKTAYA
jgi:hypothetical protein